MRDRIGLNCREVIGRQLVGSTNQLGDALAPKRLDPFHADRIRIAGRRRPVIGGDDEMLGRIEGVGELVERDEPGPLEIAGGSVARQRPVTARAERNAAGRVVADVPVHVGVNEILRRYDEYFHRIGELVPVARFVEEEQGSDGRIV